MLFVLFVFINIKDISHITYHISSAQWHSISLWFNLINKSPLKRLKGFLMRETAVPLISARYIVLLTHVIVCSGIGVFRPAGGDVAVCAASHFR